MAGRGRGRGHRMTSFSVEVVGVATPSNQQPTPVFPLMEQKPLPLTGGEEAEYLLALKQEFRGAMKSIPSFIQPAAAHRDVERYSDKYHSSDQSDGLMEWTTDWRRLPKELRVPGRKPPTRCAAAPRSDGVPSDGVPSDGVPSAQKRKKVTEKQEVLLTLENLEKKEEEQRSSGEEEEEEKKKKQEEEEVEGEEEYDEEEFEEETDYIMSYFDNGEDFGGESDDNMDEAIY
ncbi:DNA-directed RNA polymerase III subunit RPC7-like [Antennarius striatus]|uniref:DNA-directed RNA polymerase III subunit RPC7-like n=1 Tax=Antennarius striatus TaxID=241820 RepID=UPI0035B0ED35